MKPDCKHKVLQQSLPDTVIYSMAVYEVTYARCGFCGQTFHVVQLKPESELERCVIEGRLQTRQHHLG